MDLRELHNAVDLISKLKEGETIDSYNGEIQNKSYWSTTFYRTLYGDSRIRMCQYVQGIVNQLITIVVSDKTLREEIMSKIIPLQSGLRILINTYHDDLVRDNIQPLISELDILRSRYKVHKKSNETMSTSVNIKIVENEIGKNNEKMENSDIPANDMISLQLEEKLSSKLKRKIII